MYNRRSDWTMRSWHISWAALATCIDLPRRDTRAVVFPILPLPYLPSSSLLGGVTISFKINENKMMTKIDGNGLKNGVVGSDTTAMTLQNQCFRALPCRFATTQPPEVKSNA